MKPVTRILKKLCWFGVEDSGVTAIEYGLIAALIAVVIITVVKAIGTNLNDIFSQVAANL